MEFGLGIGIIDFLQLQITVALSLFHTHYNSLQQAIFSVYRVFTNLLLTASNGKRYPSSGFPNCPRASATTILD
jgi:hypothetical protein